MPGKAATSRGAEVDGVDAATTLARREPARKEKMTRLVNLYPQTLT